VRVNSLLKVLDLLPDFLQLGLARNDVLGNAGVIGFRAERIQLPENFLGDEFKTAADGLVFAKMMRELREVAFEPS
jgi:hypothetical protein